MIQLASQQIHIQHPSQGSAACNLCGSFESVSLGRCSIPLELRSNMANPLFRSLYDDFHNSDLYACLNCGLHYRSPQPRSELLARLYRELPEEAWTYDRGDVMSWHLACKLLRQENAATVQLKIVDVGTFSGQFLTMLPQHWYKAAIEPCHSVRRLLADRQIDWLGEFSRDVSSDHRERFDVVTMFDVFEHLRDPMNTLRDAIDLLRPGGKLLISTGNSSHWSWRLLGGQHWYLHTLQHLSFANEQSLRWIADSQGLKISNLVSHSHKRRGLAEKFRHCLETVHWSARCEVGWRRSIAGIIQRIPGQHRLIHRDRAPMAVSLQDHLLVCYEKPIV